MINCIILNILIVLPSSFLRKGSVLSQLDGEGMRAMERQQEQASKESCKEHLLK